MSSSENLVLTFLLNALWQVAAVAAVAAAACWTMRNGPARHRHAVCVAALVLALGLPLASLRPRTVQPQPVTVTVPVALEMQAAQVPAGPRAGAQPEPDRPVTLPALAAMAALCLFGLFLAFRLARLAWAGAKTLRICREALSRPLHVDLAARCAASLGVRGAVLRWSDTIPGPVTAGRLVILPLGMADAPVDVLATAIGHEMAHLARRDFAWNLLYELLYLPVSFHPAAMWLRREIDRTRELACDELVSERLLEPRTYAQSIMTIAATMAGLARPGYTLGVFDGDILEERIQRLLSRRAIDGKRARLLLATGLGSLAVCLVIASGLAISARAQTSAQSEVRAGVDAYNRGDLAGAEQRFRGAVAADPGNANARLQLANAILRQATPENGPQRIAEAKEQYEAVLARDPYNASAISALAAYGGAKDAQKWHGLLLDAIRHDPSNPVTYYAAGALDWQMVYPSIHAAQQAAGLSPNDYFIPDGDARRELRRQYLPAIEEGFRMLQIALDRNPHSDSSMAYLNLLFRAKAAIDDTRADAAADVAKADQWVGKAIGEMRSHKGQQPAPLDPDAPPPTPAVALPPPPPPPPPGTAIRPRNPLEGKQ
jgi:beta-lactamase regulating signal transducer with metallopeptidase domain